jgi:hypothetical protein
MPRKSKREAILERLEADESMDLEQVREIARGFARILWLAAHSPNIADVEREAARLSENIAIYSVDK